LFVVSIDDNVKGKGVCGQALTPTLSQREREQKQNPTLSQSEKEREQTVPDEARRHKTVA
jgi:hypothetical protein